MLHVVGPEEVGPELQPRELVERTVVILSMQGQPMMIKRVHTIATGYIAFQSTELGKILYMALMRRQDGTLGADSKTQVRVFEYMGGV